MQPVPKPLFSCLALFFGLLLFAHTSPATMGGPIPESLKPWIPWVEDQDKTRLCPTGTDETPLCIWPNTLTLRLDDEGARFSMDWEVFSESAVPLPGDEGLMPRDVRVNGSLHPLLVEKNLPLVYLKPGAHRLEGRFSWPRIPDTLQIPPEIARIQVYRDNRLLSNLLRDERGRLWLRQPASVHTEAAEHRRTSIRIYRKIQDGHPLEMETRIQLAVSGEPRQETLPIPLPENSALVLVDSPLPLKPSMAEGLVVDLKPGNFTLRLIHLLSGNDPRLSVPGRQMDEIWVFVPRPELRAAELQGGKSIDPRQTSLPHEWKSQAAYAMDTQASPSLHIRESRPELPEDRLHMKRDIWLDFNGQGATVRDQITGLLHSRRYLGMEAAGPLLPGRITYLGQDRLITLHEQLQGIALPPGPLSLTAISRMDQPVSGKKLPLGWQATLENQDITLHLPPGWHLATIQGGRTADQNSLFSRWTLLDFFFLVLLSGAALKIWGIRWGLAFAIAIAFFHHSFPLPLPYWFFLAATAALGKYFSARRPHPWALAILSGLHLFLLLAAVLAALPYAAEQIRTALYPQLERLEKRSSWDPHSPAFTEPFLGAESLEHPESAPPRILRSAKSMDAVPLAAMAPEDRPKLPPVTQTGPGVPDWQWRSIPIQTGFAGPSHSLTLLLIPPLAASLAAFFRVAFVALVLARLVAGFPYTAPPLHRTAAILSFLFLLSPLAIGKAQADFPPEYLLRELKEKITTRPACHPHCGRSGPAILTLDSPDTRRPAFILELELHAGSTLAFALPETDPSLPAPALALNGKNPSVLRWHGRNLVVLKPGIHRLRITGDLPRGRFRVNFPAPPDSLTLQAPGWRVEGLSGDGRIRDMLTFTPAGESPPDLVAEEPDILPFVRVHRSIHRGREWEVRTSLSRAYPGKGSGHVRIPLLPGETILREGLTIRDGHVEVPIPPFGQNLSWESRLPEKDSLRLQMAQTLDFGESWEILGDTDRALRFSGDTAPPRSTGRGLLWQPLPGQHLDILFPAIPPAPGPILTTEKLLIKLDAGKERRRLVLEANIRSGKALQHPITGPEKGVLQELRINGELQPLPRENEPLLLSLTPGSHTLVAVWELPQARNAFSPQRIRMPTLNLDMPTVNILQEMHLDPGQWLLWTYGPLLGPGVRIWGWVLLVLAGSLLFALKARLSPLRTRDWILLGLGLAPLSPLAILIVVAGFFLLHWRSTQTQNLGKAHNLLQCGLCILLFTMGLILLAAVRNGLLGVPDMQIAGNGSSPHLLRWTADRSNGAPPGAGVWLLPLSFWRIFMFAWALWLAARVLSWAPWAWRALLTGVAWQGKTKTRPEDTGLRLDLPQSQVSDPAPKADRPDPAIS